VVDLRVNCCSFIKTTRAFPLIAAQTKVVVFADWMLTAKNSGIFYVLTIYGSTFDSNKILKHNQHLRTLDYAFKWY
jgi:hypothetical protein